MSKKNIDTIEIKVQRLFAKACVQYALLQNDDKVLVALSGGKDSLELVRLFGRQQRVLKPRIVVEAVHVVMENIPYESDIDYLHDFCEGQGVKLTVIRTSFDETIPTKKPKCFLCSWNRRKAIFNFASQYGFNKVALGHHQDDVLITLLMNMFFEGSMQTMPPLLKMDNYPFSIIRPMCLVPEVYLRMIAEIQGFKKQNKFCPHETRTRRHDVAKIYAMVEEMNPEVRYSLWASMINICKNMLPIPKKSKE